MRLVRRKSRRPEAVEKLQLERVIGLTSTNANGVASNPATGDIAFLAGCVVVVFSTETYRQTRFFMVSRTPKALSCVAYSLHGGKLIAAGECGHQPAVIVWDASDGSCLAQLKAHKYGISCVRFSPNGKYLLSAGFPHDGQICLFDFKSGTMVSKVKAATALSPVSEMQFASDGSFFVTAGSNQLKLWSLGFNVNRPRSAGVGLGTNTLDGRNINLGSLHESSFVAVASQDYFKDGGGTNEIQPVYALASAGILCLLHRGLAVKKWVNLKVQQGYSLCISGSHIACACNDGIVHIFMTETLTYVATLPRPAPLGFHDLTDANACNYLAMHNVNGIVYPDAVACRFVTPVKLVVIYADHSLFIWDLRSFSKIQKCQSFLSHSECIWDVINLPGPINQGTDPLLDYGSARGLDGQGMFATCSSDGSVRLWRIECAEFSVCNPTEVNRNHGNVYDKSMSGVLYQDKRGEPDLKSSAANQINSTDSCRGFRSLSASYDGRFLAAGDRCGNLHIYDLNSLQIANFKEAHDAEILTLSFGSVAVVAADNQREEVMLLASGGRDRLVHIYNASRDFEVIETLDDHSASVTALKFACDGSKLLSSSADKSVVFRNIESNLLDIKSTRYHQEMASRGTIYDLDIDTSKKLAVTVGQDKKLNYLSLSSGKSVKNFKPEGDSGEPIKVKIDPSGTCLVCSHSDKSLRIYDISNGELLSSGQGHSEVITGVIFMPDCKRLISVSGDSCVFVWKLPSSVSKMMRKRCNFSSESQACRASMNPLELSEKQDAISSTPSRVDMSSAEETDTVTLEAVAATSQAGSGISSAFKFSVSRLPHWAQAKVSDTIAKQDENNLEDCSLYSSDSRWTKRLGGEGYKLFCEPEVLIPPATVLPNKCGLPRRFTIEPSASSAYSTPESSLESQLSGTSSFSPNVSERKHNHWKTVHTLFFDEEEYMEDDAFSKSPLLIPPSKDKERQNVNHLHAVRLEQEEPENCSKEDGTVVYLSENEQQPAISMITMLSQNQCVERFNSKQEVLNSFFQTPDPLACMVNYKGKRTESVFLRSNSSPSQSCRFDSTKEIQCLPGSLKENELERQGHIDQLTVPTVDEMSDEDESDQPLCPDSDLFSSHFGNLSTAMKVQAGQASARSSFSARFFAQACHPLPVLSLFQDSPRAQFIKDREKNSTSAGVEISSSTPLSKEREILKLKELQDHIFTGIATSQITSCSQNLLMNEEASQEFDAAQQVLCIVKEQGPLTFSHTSNFDSQADDEQCSLPSCTLKCATVAYDTQVKLHRISPTTDHKVCADWSLHQDVQEEVPSIPCDNSFSKKENCASNKDVMYVESSASGGKNGGALHDDVSSSKESKDQCMDVSTDVQGSTTGDSLNQKETLKRALQDLIHAVDKALASFKELDLTSTESSKAMVTDISNLHEEFIPPTLQKVWLLSDSMTAMHQTTHKTASACHHLSSLEYSRNSYSDHQSLRLSNTGMTSRPWTAASVVPASSSLESTDIEGFIQDYSVRFSTTLASQVLALVKKGLSCDREK